MLFKDLKPNYQVFFFDKEKLIVTMGKVVSVSVPRYMPTQTAMVVDVTIEADGITHTYSIPETSSLTYANNLVLATSNESIVHEVQAMKTASEQHLAETDQHRKVVERCNTLLEEIDTTFAEKRKQDKRIEGIESEVKNLSAIVRDFINEFKK